MNSCYVKQKISKLLHLKLRRECRGGLSTNHILHVYKDIHPTAAYNHIKGNFLLL